MDISKVVKDTIREIGYTDNADGFNADSIAVLSSIDEQSADIALGVDKAYESKLQGATKDYGTGRHGGGAFSGKDPTKVDRSGAYAARWVAKNLVAAGVADKLEIELAYAIGVAKPVSITVDTFGTGKYAEEKIEEIVQKVFDLRSAAIIDALDLRRPIYKQTAAYGHFGRTDIDLLP